MTPTMIERVARAMFAKLTAHADVLRPGAPFLSWDALPDEQKLMTRAAARAAIEAMREPTEVMESAFYAACDEHGHVLWRSGYRAMIDAALPPPPEGQ